MSFFVSCCSLCFKVYVVLCKYCYPSLFLFPFAWNTFFLLLILIQCVFRPEVSFLQPSYIWILFWGDIHLVTLCLLTDTFSPFKFTVIIENYVLIAILLIVFCSSFLFFFSLALFSCGLMTIFSIMIGFFSLSVCESVIDFDL